jgi:hypothetical protein
MKLLDTSRSKALVRQTNFFRIRRNLRGPGVYDPAQFDAPPAGQERQFWRFDSADMCLLYGSPTLSVCLHECRVLLTDDIHAATIVPTRELRLADLSGDYLQKPKTPFEDLTYFFNGLILSTETYEICRRLAKAIKNKLSVDGIIYKSFFTTIVNGEAINYGLFDRPVADGRVSVASINIVRLDRVEYQYSLGPALNLETKE